MQISNFNWIAIAALAIIAPTGESAATSDAPTDLDCEDAWNLSSASTSCGVAFQEALGWRVDTSQYYVAASSGTCRVMAECALHDAIYQPIENHYSGSTDEVEALNNCDGYLRTANC